MGTMRLAICSDDLSQFNGDEILNDGRVQTSGLGQAWCESATADAIGYDASQDDGFVVSTAPSADMVNRHGAIFLRAFGNQNQFQDPGNEVDLRSTWFTLRPGFAIAADTVVAAGPMTRVTDRYCTYCVWLAASFTMPAVSSTVSITVDNTETISAALSAAVAISGTARLYIDGGNWMQIVSVEDATHCTVQNTGVAGATVSCFLS